MGRYKVEIIDYKQVGNSFGIIDNAKLANAVELMVNAYDDKGYSMIRSEMINTNGMMAMMLLFERYDFGEQSAVKAVTL